VRATLEAHLLNGSIYPEFQKLPSKKPAVSFSLIKPYQPEAIDGHRILAIPVNHPDTTVGYQVSDGQGQTVFYTADTGPGLSECWKYVTPQLLLVDVTLPDAYQEFARETGHLTPCLLKKELITFQEHRGYLPRVIAVHMDARLEPEIKEELAAVAQALNITITIAREGMQLYL
jgi:ribonuclease BN (tRNA processing enzyme)